MVDVLWVHRLLSSTSSDVAQTRDLLNKQQFVNSEVFCKHSVFLFGKSYIRSFVLKTAPDTLRIANCLLINSVLYIFILDRDYFRQT